MKLRLTKGILKTNLITFTPKIDVAEEYAPKPATKHVPDWYKATSNRIGKKEPSGTATIKKCIPVFDAITAGYVLVTPFDVWVKQIDGEPQYMTANSGQGMVEFHPVMQASKHPISNGLQFPKWINPWAIKTPKGYSTLFVPPMHNPNPWFQIAEGIVDTDEYFTSVNFPFVLKDASYEGLIPAGTPMAQVIPFKRESWQMQMGKDEAVKEQNKVIIYLNSQFFDRYKRMFWNRKEYK
jgi:hypothetical protein